MDEIYIPIKSDDGVDLKIGMSLDEAERTAKWIAAAVHKARTGHAVDEVGFVYWQTGADPEETDTTYLISVKDLRTGERYTTHDDYVDYGEGTSFEYADYNELCAWAEFPEPTRFEPMGYPEDEE